MAFHHRVKAHHHASIWAIAALTFAASSLTYTNAVLTYASSSGPSQKTKDFFGAGDSKSGADDRPQVCKDDEEAQKSKPTTDSTELRQQYVTERTALETAIGSLEAEEAHYTEGDPGVDATRAALAAKRAQYEEVKAKIAALPEEVKHDASTGERSDYTPSAACISATVTKVRNDKKSFRVIVTEKILPAFAKVAAATTKVSNKIPELEAAGVDAKTIAEIKSYLADISKDTDVLLTFMSDEKKRLDDFLDDTDEAAYAKLRSWGDKVGGNSAAAAADDLVSKFEKLVTVVDAL